jgi:hypothetical protein
MLLEIPQALYPDSLARAQSEVLAALRATGMQAPVNIIQEGGEWLVGIGEPNSQPDQPSFGAYAEYSLHAGNSPLTRGYRWTLWMAQSHPLEPGEWSAEPVKINQLVFPAEMLVATYARFLIQQANCNGAQENALQGSCPQEVECPDCETIYSPEITGSDVCPECNPCQNPLGPWDF